MKRTNINLDTDLVAAAAHLLGTHNTADTIHAALREIVAHTCANAARRT